MTGWIIDRLPTEADGDGDGEVTVLGDIHTFFQLWTNVTPGQAWRRTRYWRPPAPATTPRLFASITRADDRYLALADDGTAWQDWGQGWVQMDPLPAREVQS